MTVRAGAIKNLHDPYRPEISFDSDLLEWSGLQDR